jgi:hypothetical protein
MKNLQVIGAHRISTLEAIATQYGKPWRAHYNWPKGLALSEHY